MSNDEELATALGYPGPLEEGMVVAHTVRKIKDGWSTPRSHQKRPVPIGRKTNNVLWTIELAWSSIMIIFLGWFFLRAFHVLQ